MNGSSNDYDDAVAIILRDETGKWLITVRPDDDTFPNHAGFPAGRVEPGETHEDALHREAAEELRVTIRPLVKLGFTAVPGTNIMLHAYHCEIVPPYTDVNPDPAETKAHYWLPKSSIGTSRNYTWLASVLMLAELLPEQVQ